MMKLYAVKSNHGELWDWNIENWHDYTDRSNGDFTATKDTADDCAADHGGRVVELVEKPEPVEVTADEVKIIQKAKECNFGFSGSALRFIYGKTSVGREDAVLRAYSTDSYRVKSEPRYYVRVPHTYESYYFKVSDGLTVASALALSSHNTKFTQDEIKQYALQDYERVKVPTDDDTNE